MALTIYKHRITVQENTVSPQGPLDCGTAGDDGAAQLIFAPLDAAYAYRLEIVTGDGAYDITKSLTVQDSAVTQDIPAAWTAAGTAAMRLVQLEVQDGIECARRYYPPVLLQFAYRDEGCGGVTAAPLWQTMLTRAEAVLDEMSALAGEAEGAITAAKAAAGDAADAKQAALSAAASADAAAPYAQSAADAAEEAEGSAADCAAVLAAVQELSGIAGDIEEMAGEDGGIYHPCVTVDTALDAASRNPVTNAAITDALNGKAELSHRHTAGDISAGTGYWWGDSDTVDDALQSVSDELSRVWDGIPGHAAMIATEQPGGIVEDSLEGLWATKADKVDMIAESIAFSYGSTINNVADALTLILGKLGV